MLNKLWPCGVGGGAVAVLARGNNNQCCTAVDVG